MQATLRRGAAGPPVRLLQSLLGLPVDGRFGPATEAAVRAAQQRFELAVDGAVGPQTWAAIMRAAAEGAITAVPAGPRRDALALALSDVGRRESPTGSNGGPEIAHLVDGYNAFHRIGGAAPPWCAIACCSWVRLALGASSWKATPFGTWFGGVSGLEDWARAHGAWRAAAAAGGIFTMARDGSGSDAATRPGFGHCGLVLSVFEDHVLTVEGNVGDAVALMLRPKGAIRGCAAWWEAR